MNTNKQEYKVPEEAHRDGLHDEESDVACSYCKALFDSTRGPPEEEVLVALDRASLDGEVGQKVVDVLTDHTDPWTGLVDVEGFLGGFRELGAWSPGMDEAVRLVASHA